MLNVKQVERLIREAKAGATADDGGLYLRITPQGSASWQYRYQLHGKRRLMGLGACSLISLAEARQKAAEARSMVKQGIDPLEQRQVTEQAAVTFKAAAEDYIQTHRAGWRNAKHAQQWTNTLSQYVYPVMGHKPLEQVTTSDVLAVLKPLWQEKPETANRVRNRIELVIDAAKAQGQYPASNPALWRGHLDKLLPKRSKASKTHHAALPYADLPKLFAKLTTERDSLSASALTMTILTACRTSEVLLAQWSEIDLRKVCKTSLPLNWQTA